MKSLTRTLVVLTLLAAAFAPAAATAHQGDANYRSKINSVTPAVDGLQLEVQNFDDHLELVNRTGKDVLVKGYDGEPYFRIGADGLVEVNLNSPTHYLNEDRFADVELPDRADAEARPDWSEVNDSGLYVWHDHRSHYMGVGTPSQVEDESVETVVFDYEIPMAVDGRPVSADGTLTWVGEQSGPPVFIWIALAAIVVGGALVVVRMRNRRHGDETADVDGPGGNDAW